MMSERRAGLEAADPRMGQTLRFDGVDWEVTDHSSYWSDDGYRVTEWECESEDSQAYLLKEIREGAPIRWFFTRQIEADAVALPGGETLSRWLARNRSADPPAALTFRAQTYEYDESTEGTYEDEPGQRARKTTWDYWDAADAHNLAVEVWESGDLHCYHGAYIEPGQVALEGGAGPPAGMAGPGGAAAIGLAAGLARTAAAGSGRASGLVANPFLAAVVCVPFAYVVPFFMGWPFDKSIAAALCLAGFGGWVFALVRAPQAAALAVLATPVLLVAFWRFPPLTSAVGVAALLAAPAAVVWLGGRSAPARLPVVYAAASTVAGPALILGVYHYFRFAPGPHTLGQLGLALGPALLAGLAASVVAAAVLTARSEKVS